MYVGFYAICVWNCNWWFTQDHFLIKHWSQHKHRCSAPVVGFEEYSLWLVSRYSTVRPETLTWRKWGLWFWLQSSIHVSLFEWLEAAQNKRNWVLSRHLYSHVCIVQMVCCLILFSPCKLLTHNFRWYITGPGAIASQSLGSEIYCAYLTFRPPSFIYKYISQVTQLGDVPVVAARNVPR